MRDFLLFRFAATNAPFAPTRDERGFAERNRRSRVGEQGSRQL